MVSVYSKLAVLFKRHDPEDLCFRISNVSATIGLENHYNFLNGHDELTVAERTMVHKVCLEEDLPVGDWPQSDVHIFAAVHPGQVTVSVVIIL